MHAASFVSSTANELTTLNERHFKHMLPSLRVVPAAEALKDQPEAKD